jgi:hypothetical protein
MIYRLCLLAVVVVPCSANCQTPPASATVRNLTALGGTVQFAVPMGWNALTERDTGSVARFVYHVPNPAMDSIGRDWTNVIINVRRTLGSRTFASLSDSLLGVFINSTMIVLSDTTVRPAQRAVTWGAQIKSTPYIGFDNIATSGDVWVHVRIVVALSERTPEDWTERLSQEMKQLLHTVRIGSKAAFPAPLGYPGILDFRPSR